MTITLTREEAQQVLDALKNCRATGELDEQAWNLATQTIETLRARINAPEPEPVAYLLRKEFGFGYEQADRADYGAFPVYTTPPQREWQGLTLRDVGAIFDRDLDETDLDIARAIEAKLREKNGNL